MLLKPQIMRLIWWCLIDTMDDNEHVLHSLALFSCNTFVNHLPWIEIVLIRVAFPPNTCDNHWFVTIHSHYCHSQLTHFARGLITSRTVINIFLMHKNETKMLCTLIRASLIKRREGCESDQGFSHVVNHYLLLQLHWYFVVCAIFVNIT